MGTSLLYLSYRNGECEPMTPGITWILDRIYIIEGLLLKFSEILFWIRNDREIILSKTTITNCQYVINSYSHSETPFVIIIKRRGYWYDLANFLWFIELAILRNDSLITQLHKKTSFSRYMYAVWKPMS